MNRTLHASELAWLELMLLGAYPRRYGEPHNAAKADISPAVPKLTMPSGSVEPGDTIDLLDPEGVTLAQVAVDGTNELSDDVLLVLGTPQLRTLVTHPDYAEMRQAPDAVTTGWHSRPAVALWGDPPLTLALRQSARRYARELDQPLLQVIALESGRDTDSTVHLPARLARLESTRDDGDQAVIVPDPGWQWDAADILAKATVVARYGATTLLVPPNRLTDLGHQRAHVEQAAEALGVRLIQVPVDVSETELPREIVDDIVLTDSAFPDWFAEPSVGEAIRELHRPRLRGGFSVLLSGLSGSGKSTVARHLTARLLEQDDRSVSLLDGDVVRHHLSKGLGFSREDRDTNVRRIGFVASEIVKAGGIAVACPIAPYDATRKDVRAMVQHHGGFVLVHVATPLEECERRDRKGLYAKARRGEIPEFTGISDPYEQPADAEVVVDTTDITVDDAAEQVMGALRRLGYLPRR